MDPHALQSYRDFEDAEDQYIQLIAAGYPDMELQSYERHLDQLRQAYEMERREIERQQLESIPSVQCRINDLPQRSLREIAPLVAASRQDEIFVFDFDDTLAVRYGMVWNAGYQPYDQSKQADDFVGMPGFDDLINTLKQTNNFFLVLSNRNADGVAEADSYLTQFGVEVFAVGTRQPDGTSISKGDWLLALINANPHYTVWNFVDDIGENLESAREVISSKCPRSLTLNLFQVYGIQEFGHNISIPERERNQEQYFATMR